MERLWFVRIFKAVTGVTVNRTTEKKKMVVKVGAFFSP